MSNKGTGELIGLTSRQVSHNFSKYGPNELQSSKPKNILIIAFQV